MAVRAGGKVRVMVVDDHPIVREGLVRLLAAQSDLEVTAEACDVPSAVAAMKEPPDLLIVDIALGKGSGIDLIRHVRQSHTKLPILVLSMHGGFHYPEQALRAGANGYVTKFEGPDKVLAAVRKVLAGEPYLSDAISATLVQRAVVRPKDAPEDDLQLLSGREREVFRLLGRGLGTRLIAGQLGVSVRTIDTYREKIKHKLNLRNASELLQYAIQRAPDLE